LSDSALAARHRTLGSLEAVTVGQEISAMSFATPTTVVSGKSYVVLLVEDRGPSSLDEFDGATNFTVDMDGRPYRVQGSGRFVDGAVRYHEKDVDNNGKDIRVWRVIRHDDGAFLASHAASF
jgi:hypothetical protein